MTTVVEQLSREPWPAQFGSMQAAWRCHPHHEGAVAGRLAAGNGWVV